MVRFMKRNKSINSLVKHVNNQIEKYDINIEKPRPPIDFHSVSNELDHLMLEGAKQLANIITDNNANPTHKVTAIRTIIEYKKIIMELTKLEQQEQTIFDDINKLKIVNG
jgi:hypothetical protein